MTTLEPPPNCVFFHSPNIYARARITFVSRRDLTVTVQLVDGLYDRLGKQLYPPGSYFTTNEDQMESRVHSVIRNGEALKACLIHHRDERMRGTNGRKSVFGMVCDELSGRARPITTDDVDVLAQLVAK